MDLTPENKQHIDSLSYADLLRRWRFAPGGYEWFQGETGDYWAKRMDDEREKIGPAEAAAWSKRIGYFRR